MQADRISTETNSTCYSCGRQGEVLYRGLTERLFGAPGEWTLKKCTDAECGLIWLGSRPALDEIGKAYRHYYTHGQTGHARQTRMARSIRVMLHSVGIFLLGLRKERRRYKCIYLDKTPPGRLLSWLWQWKMAGANARVGLGCGGTGN